ncbi:IS66 family insertion sequence element accessory protein TnpB [Echinicola soli]|uniref:IS66 family insertion sequence element accessory protein TnpB n=1 Tax=Echinicola soli TaxID=2591634 RepID=A0A514CKW0_9BACT|nr:IS66 family insertion sequence element accessory protein TnpB [Echinicola soli]QDH80442.1 IS66 family insertion sequence element accessory protein TnpB [Echinicola soli]
MDKREEMLLLMEEFENSGQTQKEFSATMGIGFPKFNYWYRKLKKEKGSGGTADFVRVDTSKPETAGRATLELEYPNGVKLKLSSGDLSLVSHLIRLF